MQKLMATEVNKKFSIDDLYKKADTENERLIIQFAYVLGTIDGQKSIASAIIEAEVTDENT